MKRNLKLPRLLCFVIALGAVACFIASAGYQRAAALAATATPTPTFTISGVITDTNGQPIADVPVILVSDVADTQIVFTDQSGNYLFNYSASVSHSLNITPSKSGYIFNPLAVTFISSSFLSGDRTQSFTGTQAPIPSPFQIPILLSRESPQRAIALDSVTLLSDPFSVTNVNNFSSDQRTRISLFAVNLDLLPGEPISAVTAQAENSVGQIFPLTLEHFSAVPNFPWLKQLVLKLPDEIANSIEVRVSIKLRGVGSNKVIVKVKP